MCDKRAYGSKSAAHHALHTMGQSVRVYRCTECHKYHVTKSRYTKGSSDKVDRDRLNQKKRRRETDV